MPEYLLYAILFLAGMFAGFINTLAGGGSVIVLPILITLCGIPGTIANGTNRVAILLQNASGVYHFHRAGKIELKGKWWSVLAAVLGSIIGASFAVKISNRAFEIVLAFVLLMVVTLMLVPRKQKPRKGVRPVVEFALFLGLGLYGGFVQTGVGLLFLATLNLIENYDLVRANAFKVTVVLLYTVFAVAVFAFSGKILWLYGLILASGNMVGAWLGVRSAVKKGDRFVKAILVVAAALASLKLLGVVDWLLGLVA